jgi:hypothetical protein
LAPVRPKFIFLKRALAPDLAQYRSTEKKLTRILSAIISSPHLIIRNHRYPLKSPNPHHAPPQYPFPNLPVNPSLHHRLRFPDLPRRPRSSPHISSLHSVGIVSPLAPRLIFHLPLTTPASSQLSTPKKTPKATPHMN